MAPVPKRPLLRKRKRAILCVTVPEYNLVNLVFIGRALESFSLISKELGSSRNTMKKKEPYLAAIGVDPDASGGEPR